ncbi:hypothetical protein KEHDKFFH_06530 [Marinobacter maroccanus]|uniref:Uncharacterized protein n=1 Tax=Marinobacter maroccanus TaxID=2055143 RepID=A0A2S5ZC30_9GAMM|nr:hypothetical protein KEHDKFFH_06530 [Marinobacter maroccanus]
MSLFVGLRFANPTYVVAGVKTLKTFTPVRKSAGEVPLQDCLWPWMATVKRTWVRRSAYEAKLHATAERLQSAIAGWTRVRVLVACPEGEPPPGDTPKAEGL